MTTDPQIKRQPDSFALAQIDPDVIAARSFPRDQDLAKADAVKMATVSADVAEACNYSFPRAGKTISGPSVRLAEIVAHAWGHLSIASRIVSDDGQTIIVEGAVHDRQNGNRISQQIARRVTDKRGNRYSDDMVTNTQNAAQSVALRDVIFRAVPKSFWGPVYEAAVRACTAGKIPLPDRRANALKWFRARGLEEADILQGLGVAKLEDIGEAEIRLLSGARNKINEEGCDPRSALGIVDRETVTLEISDPEPTAAPDRPPWAPSETAMAAEVTEPGGEG